MSNQCRYSVSDADRCILFTDTAAAAAIPAASPPAVSDVNVSSSTALPSRPHRKLRRFDSLPGDVRRYDVKGHVVLSSTRLVEKLTATLNALTVDCRQPGARYHGNEVTPDRCDSSGSSSSTSDTGDTKSSNNGDDEPELSNRVVDESIVMTPSQTDNQQVTAEVERLPEVESPTLQSDPAVAKSLADSVSSARPTRQQLDHTRCSNDDLMTTMDVVLDKGPLGLGFCIDGGQDAPAGSAPITIKRLFKGSNSNVSSRLAAEADPEILGAQIPPGERLGRAPKQRGLGRRMQGKGAYMQREIPPSHRGLVCKLHADNVNFVHFCFV